MKKFTGTWFAVWFLVIVMIALTAIQAFSQDTLSTPSKPCPCDSAFVFLVKYRIERQTNWNSTIKNEIRDHNEAIALLEHRLDSLRAYVQEWSNRMKKASKSKK